MAGQPHKITVREKTPVPLYGGLYGVSDETRTRDSQDHNLVLYQLNYTHQECCLWQQANSSGE